MSKCTLEPSDDFLALASFVVHNPYHMVSYLLTQSMSLYILSRAGSTSRLNGFQRFVLTLLVTFVLFGLKSLIKSNKWFS